MTKTAKVVSTAAILAVAGFWVFTINQVRSNPDTVPLSGVAGQSTAINSSEGKLILEPDGTVDLITGGQRRPFRSPEVFFSHDFKWSDVVAADSADLGLPKGPVMVFRDGTLVKDPNEPLVYLVSAGKKRGFESAGAFLNLGYAFSNIVVADPETFADLPTGQNINTAVTVHPPGTLVNDGGTISQITATGRGVFDSTEVFYSYYDDFDKVVPANAADRVLPVENVFARRVIPSAAMTLTIDKKSYVVGEAPTYEIRNAPPNGVIRWTSWKNNNPSGENNTSYGETTSGDRTDGQPSRYAKLTGNPFTCGQVGTWKKEVQVIGYATSGVTNPKASITFTVTATASCTTTQPSFYIELDQTALSTTAGNSAVLTVKAVGENGFTSPITLTAGGAFLPSGISLSLSQTTISPGQTASLKVSVQSTVPAGTYNFVVTGTSGGVQSNRTGTITVTAPNVQATLSVSPPALGFTATVGGTPPASQNLTLSNSSSIIANYTANYSGSGAATWFATAIYPGSVFPSGSSGSSISFPIAVNPTGLAAGTYSTNLIISGNFPTLTIPVTLTVTSATQPSLTVGLDPSTPPSQNILVGSTNIDVLRFKLTAGLNNDVTVTRLDIGRYGISSCNFSNMRLYDGSVQIGFVSTLNVNCAAVFDGLSLTIPKASSKTLSFKLDIPLSAKVGDIFAFGVVGASCPLSCPNGISGIPVYGNNMTIVSTQATLSVSPPALGFTAAVGGTPPASQGITVTNASSQCTTISYNYQISFTETNVPNWLSLSPATIPLYASSCMSGSTLQGLTTVVNISNLSAGTYHAAITFSGYNTATKANANITPQSVSVTLTVNAPVKIVSFTANGAASLVAHVNDVINYNWSASNADTITSFYSVYRNTDSFLINPVLEPCRTDGLAGPYPWVANTALGPASGTVGACQVGYTYVITLRAQNSQGVDQRQMTIRVE